jgi:hypothetical protein
MMDMLAPKQRWRLAETLKGWLGRQVLEVVVPERVVIIRGQLVVMADSLLQAVKGRVRFVSWDVVLIPRMVTYTAECGVCWSAWIAH